MVLDIKAAWGIKSVYPNDLVLPQGAQTEKTRRRKKQFNVIQLTVIYFLHSL